MSGMLIDEPVLVLNRNWQPVNFTPVSEAICNVMRDMAAIIDPETYYVMRWEEWLNHTPANPRWIKTASSQVAAPDVIMLKKYGEIPPRRINLSKINLARRDHYSCQYCGKPLPIKAVTVDHVMPRSRGGGNSWENCVSACSDCNSRKADQTPQEAGMRLRGKPVKPNWSVKLRLPGERRLLKSWEPFLAKEGA